MNIIIPLCGRGERFKKIGFKPFVKVYEKPILYYLLDKLNGDASINIIVNENTHDLYRKKIMEDYPRVNIIDIGVQTSGALESVIKGLIKANISGSVLVLDGDSFYTRSLNYIDKKENGIVWSLDTQDKPIFSYIIDNNSQVMEIEEKKKISNKSCTGAYFFKDASDIIKYGMEVITAKYMAHGEYYISCLIKYMINKGETFKSYEVDGRHISLGTPEQVEEFKDNVYAFLFDLDGTIVISDHIYIDIWKELLHPYNISVNEEFFMQHIHGCSDSDVEEKLNIKIDRHAKTRKFNEMIDRIKIIPGSLDFIKLLRKNGYLVSIVTNCNRENAEMIISYLGIEIDHLVIGNECNEPKPSPAPYLKAMELYGICPSRSIIFEDSKTGLTSAIASNPKRVIGINTDKIPFNIRDYTDNDLLYRILHEEIKESDIASIISKCTGKETVLEQTLRGGYISDVYMTRWDSKNCVYKRRMKGDDSLIDMANKLGLFENEFYFYESISQYIPIKIPKLYSIVRDENLETDGILMENILPSKVIDLNSNIDYALRIVADIAKLHSKFTNKNLCLNFRYLQRNNGKTGQFWKKFVQNGIDSFITKWKFILTQKQTQFLKLIAYKYGLIQEKLSTGILTLCHGDLKSPNIFFNDNGEPCFLDWQYICEGKGVQDIVFLLIESFSTHKLSDVFNIITEYYYKKITEYGVQYPKQVFKDDLIYAACCFPSLVAIWFGNIDISELNDKNFPFIFIRKYLNYLDNYVDFKVIEDL